MEGEDVPEISDIRDTVGRVSVMLVSLLPAYGVCVLYMKNLGLFLWAIGGAPRSPCSPKSLGPVDLIIWRRGVLLRPHPGSFGHYARK